MRKALKPRLANKSFSFVPRVPGLVVTMQICPVSVFNRDSRYVSTELLKVECLVQPIEK